MEKTFYAYHVVTERPMRLGQHILFDGARHSGVYERVMAKRDIVDDIYKNPRKYQDEGSGVSCGGGAAGTGFGGGTA